MSTRLTHAVVLAVALCPAVMQAQQQREGTPSAAISPAVARLRDIASGKATPSELELVQAVSAGLRSLETKEVALLAIVGRGALPRSRPRHESKAQWAQERNALKSLRPDLEQAMNDGSPNIRVLAVMAIGTIGMDPERLPLVVIGDDALSVLSKAYAGEPVPFVRNEIVKTLALCADTAPIRKDLLIAALSDANDGVVAQAVKGVSMMQLPEGLDQLPRFLVHESMAVRLAAALGFARYGPSAVPYIPSLESASQTEKDDIVKKTLLGTIAVLRKAQ